MSGLCGWFGVSDGDAPATIGRMADALPQHGSLRGFASHGAQFGLAMRAHPKTGAFLAGQGIAAAIEGYPEWSDPALRQLAREAGHATALVAAYREAGADLFRQLKGAFAFAIFDEAERSALLAIDRLGIQTLCYAEPKEGVVIFGATTDAVRAHPLAGATVTPQAIFNYLFFVDRLPAPETVYREQRKLAPGEYLLLRAGRSAVKRYWQMPYRFAPLPDKAAASETLRGLLRGAVEASLAGEAPRHAGAFLSGGLDSSSVVGYAGELIPGLQSFTIGFPVEGFDETHYADIAAKRFGTEHRTYYLRPDDVLDVLNKAVQAYDEPFANSSMIPAYHCARIAGEAGIEVMLAGDGGDEIFAGNERYAKDRVFDHFAALPKALRNLCVWGAGLPLPRRGPLGRALRYIDQAGCPVPQRMLGNMFMAVAPEAVFDADAWSAIDPGASARLMDAIYDAPAEASKVQRMMHFDLRVTLADSDIRKVSRMCELAGVRVRYPFLADSLVEFAATLPVELLMPGGRLRQFYKDAMHGFLPDEIIHKQKHGFGLPYVDFMNSFAPLRSLVCDALTGLRGRGYFRSGWLQHLVELARKGELSSREGVVWDLVVLELWLQSRA